MLTHVDCFFAFFCSVLLGMCVVLPLFRVQIRIVITAPGIGTKANSLYVTHGCFFFQGTTTCTVVQCSYSRKTRNNNLAQKRQLVCH